MGQALFQKFFRRFVWAHEEAREERSLENPATPFTAAEIWGGGTSSKAGVTITTEKALTLSAVWRCVNILSGVISYLPSKPYKDTDKGRVVAKDHSTYRLFTRRMNPQYTKSVYWERAITHLLLRGNHFAEIIFNGSGDIVRYDLIHPSDVLSVSPGKDGSLFYQLRDREELVPAYRMIHVPHLGEDAMGKSTVSAAREDLGLELARRETGGKFWKDGGRPDSMLIPQQKLSPTQEAQLKDSFKGKKKEGGTILAPYGVEYVTMSMTPQDQEFIMSGNFSIATICRWFGVPLHKLSELERATMNNIEHQAIEFLQDTIAPILEKIEDEYTSKSFTLSGEEDMFLEFNMNAYQRADTQAQSESFRNGIQNGYYTPNNVARKLNEPEVEGGDRAFIQQNMMPLDSVDKVLLAKKSAPTRSRLINTIKELAELAEAEYNQNGNGNH